MTTELFESFENPYKTRAVDREEKHHLQFDVTKTAYQEFWLYVPIKGVVDRVFSNQFKNLLQRMRETLPDPKTQPLNLHGNIDKLRGLVCGSSAE